MKLNQTKVLSKDEIEAIHSATLELFETVGIKIECEETRKILQEYGAELEQDTDFVKFPESLVKEQLKLVPNSFKLHGPDGKFNLKLLLKALTFPR